jgi:phage shock protein E
MNIKSMIYVVTLAEVSKIYPDKNTEILLYCRSGGRAGKALSSLNNAGYKNVQNMSSIGDACKIRAETKVVE